MQVVEHMGEPFLRVDAYDVAALEEGVEDGVVDGAAVVLAEEVVLAAHRRRALVALHSVVVYPVDAVLGVAAQSRPELVGVVDGLAHGVGRGALRGGRFHPFVHCVHYEYPLRRMSRRCASYSTLRFAATACTQSFSVEAVLHGIEIKICVVHNKNSLVILLTKLLLLLRCPKDKIKMLKSNLISCLYHQNSLFHDIFFDILVFPL